MLSLLSKAGTAATRASSSLVTRAVQSAVSAAAAGVPTDLYLYDAVDGTKLDTKSLLATGKVRWNHVISPSRLVVVRNVAHGRRPDETGTCGRADRKRGKNMP